MTERSRPGLGEAEIERALDWLRDTAKEAAQARADRVVMEEYRKVKKAEIMAEHMDKSIAAQEREAYRDPRYIAHLEAMRTAIERDERMRVLIAAAHARIEAWRTLNANKRAEAALTS